MKVGDPIEKTYRTSEIAKVVGVHPNTVRMYEDLGLIPKPIRKENGYRIFKEIHIDQIELIRTAFQIEVLQNGLRKKIISVVKIAASGRFDKALALTYEYISNVQGEIEKAKEAIAITDGLLQGASKESSIFLKRKDVSDSLGITMDTLRNWEMNGLLKIKRKDNGYRVYSEKDIMMIKIIQSLRCANYSLSSILRMINTLFEDKNKDKDKDEDEDKDVDIGQVLNTPNEKEDIVSVCDKLIVSLHAAKENAEKMIVLLKVMKNKYLNPTL